MPRLCLGILAPVGRSRVPLGGATLACWRRGLEGERWPWRSGGRLEGGATSGGGLEGERSPGRSVGRLEGGATSTMPRLPPPHFC
ncbi:MAG TPA: hypothetical protein VH599_15895 [Ktedonobacterales bacterium]